MNSHLLRLLLAFMLLLTGLNAAHAALSYAANDRVATREEIIVAVNAAPWLSRSGFLQGNAEAIAALALGVESGGHTGVYNGKCCYGILQMDRRNIAWLGNGMTGEQYARLPLQEQINMWVELTVRGEQSDGFRRLNRMINSGQTTFDNQPIDFAFRLSCIQLGGKNCDRVLQSGNCNSWKDGFGSSICAMANGIRRQMGQQTYPGGGGGGGATHPIATFECRHNPDGSCMSVSEAMRAAFREGSGVDMETLRKVIRMLLMSTALLAAGSGTLTAWQSYAKGAIAQPAMIGYVKRATLLTLTVVVILSVM